MSACDAAGFEPLSGPVGGSLQDILATIGASPAPQWTVVYAAHARQLHSPRVTFLPFRPAPLALPTALAVRRSAPPAGVDLLLEACAAPPDCGDHGS